MSDSIKVAIKVRPLIKREKDENSSIQWVTSENTIAAIDPEFRKRSDGRFEFDHIFDTTANNNNVFNVVRPIVDAAVNGFNGTVFAYGQTSSGKTYTMMGTSEEPGIVPLAVEHMFDAITNIPGREFLLRVSYLEIYNEKVNDLLNKNQDKNSTDLKIHEDVNGQVFVKCKEEVTNSPENVLAIMNKGNKSRRIGETNMNERSSRSHTIFRITIESREASAGSDGAIQVSQLNMVDLAGSERARLTGATGERFKEGRHINLSLSTLALVIKQLSESQDYVNFRNSKLTRLLQTSLGGNAMTVMICAVTPAALDETQCTLSFASRARNVKNDPKLNEVMSDGVLLKRYAKQIDKLHTELERMKQLTQTTDFQEMESKMQEKDRINQNLEERIRLLQTRIITAANRNTIASFKAKEKRRQTWCGTGGFNKLNTSLFPTCSHLSPIKEMSPVKLHVRYKSDATMDSSFQIAFADFELELMNSEANHDEDISSDEDPFVTYRDKHRVKFIDDVIVKSPINYSDDNITFDKIEASTQTVSNNSPDTPKHTLRNRIRNLTEEYSELKEFTTLEKQLHCEDYLSELQEKRSQFEKQLENVTSDKEAFEHIASELRKKLTAAELRYTSAEDQLNVQAVELERIPDLEKKITQLSAQKIEVQNIPDLYKQIAVLTAEKDGYEHVASELRKKLNEAEQRNIILEDKLTRNVELEIPFIQTLSNNEIISFEKDKLQCKITDLQNKLTEAELNNNSMKDKLEEQQQVLQNLQEEKNIVASEMQYKLREAEEINNSIRDRLNEQQLEVQKFQDQEKQIAQLKSENHKFKLTVDDLQEQLIETKVMIGAKEDKVHEYQQNLDKFHLEDIIKERMEFERINNELRHQLTQVQLMNDSMKNNLDTQELCIQKNCDLENQIQILAIEKNEFKVIISELEEKLKEVESNNSLKNKSNEYEVNQYEINLEITNETLTSENKSEQIISELQEKLKETESCNSLIKEELNVCQEEAQKTLEEHRKSVENFAVEKSKLEDTVRQLQEKSKEAELNNNLLKDRINEQELQLEKSYDMEKEIECLTSKTKEFEYTVRELREKLANAQHCISVEDESNGIQLQKIQLDAQVPNTIFERDEQDSIKLSQQSLKSPEKELTENQSKDEINHLQSRINNLQSIIQDIQNENTYLKEQTTKSISYNESDLGNDSSKVTDDLSITKMSLDEDSAKLSADLILKNQELDEIKHIVQSLKADIENLQQTVYLLTTENSELANKLATEKECNEKSVIYHQQTIDELYERNSKIIDEKLELENNLTNLNEQLETLRSRIPEVNLNEEQIIQKYEKQISEFQAKNIELLSHLTDRTKELEMLKESKSLLYEHDCIYKDKLTNLTEKHKHLIAENGDLSTNLMDKIEENEGLKQECDILKNKLELSLKNRESIGNNDVEQLRMENTVLKTELMELKTNLKTLTEENLKISSQLIETIEDLDNARKLNSDNNTMHLSTLFNSTLINDALDKSALDDDAETKIINLQEEVNHLTNLNRKLSDLKLGTCTQCSHLNELNENRRMLKLEVKTLNRKLENLQRKFSSKSAKSDALILKAKEDLNVSACNLSLNASFSENMNVTCVEERLQSLNNELEILKEDHNKLSDLYKEKCNEVEELQNSTIMDSSSTNDKNSSIKKSPSRTSLRLENIGKVINDLQNDFKTIKENNESVKSDLTKFINEKERMLLDEINTLKTINEKLLQKLSESELLYATTLEKADIFENEVQDMTKTLQEFTIRYKEIENTKLLLEVEVDSLKEDKLMKEQTANELRQSHSCLEQELNLIKKEKEELNNDIILLEQEYNEKLDSLKAMNDKLTSSKAALSQESANYIKESENRLIELNEKINKYNSENDYLKQELIRLRDIENKFEKMKTEYQSQSQQDKTLIDDNKKLKNVLNDSSKNIIKEIKSLEPKVDTQKFVEKSVDELFQIFMQTILMKEKEVIKTMRENFDKEKQKLEDEKRQSVDSEKRTLLWVKELECEIEKLQKDLSEREIASEDLEKEIARLGHLLEESNRDREVLREKNSLLEMDLNNLQIEYNKYSKIDTANEEAIVIAQKREKQAQEMIKNKESEFQKQLKSEKETYNKQIEDLTCMIESFKTKNMELTNSIEGLEANQKQLKNIIDLKSNDLMKSNQINQKMQAELEQLTETYNDLHKELEKKELCIVEIKELLKTKCDELTEYKINLETIMPENKLLKQQINERKATIEQYKVEIETLKMKNKKEIDVIKDQLNFEELKSTELNKQIAELNNKHIVLTEEMNALRDNYTTLKHKYATLEKRVRNSTSKAQAEEQIEELKDLNRSLRNNLDGASNRITELQAVKTDLMKQVITLSSQYDAACKDNQKLKETLSSSRHNDTYTAYEKYDNLLQEKNKIALELEATKVQLNQKNKDIENYLHEIKELKEKNTELDKELDELAAVICEHDADNARLQDKYFTCRAEADELQDKIKTLEKKTQINQLQTNTTSSNKAEKSHDDECSCTILKNKIRELQLEVVSKNGKIATLELQIRSGSFPYQMKCKELQEHLSAYSNKNSELKAEMKRLQMAMIRTSAKECDVCKQRLINRTHQACQTMPEMLKFCGTSSGVIDDEIRITKLEKEKRIMRDVCRTRSKTIKELEKQIEEYEKLLNSKNS
ncbi:Centromere-associated protein E [Trachymyrmex septentrionalis]|uniref:Centromere-associated protein E n=1 Tax=Trachymyrmex septentrionalis TaxID=34720 RepID=A0A195F9F5_9HYME|nr:PREDICTED: kinesin-related protein 4-like isoform X1 [Trachymyrmex septentrionalis]KYN37073.1 Centromere-associated protein E [Trachymyrmex septentrionalis]